MTNLMYLELTLKNLQVIKLWHHLAMKDKELTREDTETITKIKALTITAREEKEMRKHRM